MTRRMPLALLLGAVLSLAPAAVLVSARAAATVVVPLSREQLVARADLVVRATVVARRSAWSADRTQILTWTTLRIDEYLKGSGKGELVLRQMGGEVDGVVTEIAGDAHLLPGEQAVIFLRRGDGVVFLSALAQSVFLVRAKDDGVTTVERDLSGLSFARWAGARMQLVEASREPREPLVDFLRVVRGLVDRGARP